MYNISSQKINIFPDTFFLIFASNASQHLMNSTLFNAILNMSVLNFVEAKLVKSQQSNVLHNFGVFS